MLILGIETSCDETSIGLLEVTKIKADFFIKPISNLLVSQVKIHEKYGGVVPILASREHYKNLPFLFKKLIREEKLSVEKDIDLVAVTNGPGLIPALLIGVNFSRTLSWYFDKPIIGVSHLSGHLFSFLLPPTKKKKKISLSYLNSLFPLIALIVSGGHTLLVYCKKINNYTIIGETLDDAAGECFDKTARILNLGYPGGPIISQLSQKQRRKKAKSKISPETGKIEFPRPMLSQNNYDFSFSGLKTAVLYFWQKLEKEEKEKLIPAIAYEIEEAITDVLVKKTFKTVKDFKVKTLIIGGGVSANLRLREKIKETIKNEKIKINFFSPSLEYCTDNAIMIALAGFFESLNKKEDWREIDAISNRKF
ncbi:MAG TPA: tRNA (adenosine(37)-N6)-threonylcarbamoyltransferase complex transferase subunit TsaD [Candidatus Paceibacterota bacterium]|nr:tRNA (adenosine(37)-N6)-threonylcarbamoyltransferase complex transferase subunit TsaD [Candidatus Paceibacterota bacterium]